jgi:hypothetical protein
MPNDSRNNNSRGLAQAPSEDWSDREGKEELGSPTDAKHYENGDSTSVNSKPIKATEKVSGPRAWLGLKPEVDMPEDLDHAEHNHFFWSKVKLAMKEPFAEFWGTFILVLFGMSIPPSSFPSTPSLTSPQVMPQSRRRSSPPTTVLPRARMASAAGSPSHGDGESDSCWESTLPAIPEPS